LLLYNIKSFEGLDEKAFMSFAELNGTYNAWPYWREFVQNITNRMQLPTLTIPVFRIQSSIPKPINEEKIAMNT
jgi:preprotein translocase subunit SecB